MVRDNVSKVEGLLRLLQQAHISTSSASQERERFTKQYENASVLVYSLECEYYPTVNEYAQFFNEFQSLCTLNPEWHTITHDVQERRSYDGVDDVTVYTITGYAHLKFIHDSPEWKKLHEQEHDCRRRVDEISKQIVELVRNLQGDNVLEKAQLAEKADEKTESDAEFWTRHTMLQKD